MAQAIRESYDTGSVNTLGAQIKAERLRRSFVNFVREFWDVVVTETLIEGPHIEYLCNELQAVGYRLRDRLPKEGDLIINIPPGTSKSTIVTQMFPAWLWTIDPTLRVLTGSHGEDLAIDHATKSRDIIQSPKYKELFPTIQIRIDQNNKTHYKNENGGERVTTSVGSSPIGFHAHIKIIDDPIKPQKNNNLTADIDAANRFITGTLSTRNVSKELTPLVLVMQRLHVNDPTGHLLSKPGSKIKHICLPATDEYPIHPESAKALYKNGLLDPLRMTREVLAMQLADLGSTDYAGQFGQQPIPLGGNIAKRDWYDIVDINDLPSQFFDEPINLYFDGAFTDKTKNDPSGILAAVNFNNELYLFNFWRGWLGFNDVMKKLIDTVDTYCDLRSRTVIETKAIGETAAQELERKMQGRINVIRYNPSGSKVDRFRGWVGRMEARHVKLIKGAWNSSFLDQITGFPNLKNDEEVDCLSMALDDNFNNNSTNTRSWKTA